MAQILYDTFTAADGTAISSHTPDSGGTWTLHTSSGGSGTIQNNRAAGTGTGNYAYYFHSVAATTAGESVTANLKLLPSASGNSGLLLRCNTASSGSFYMAYWAHSTGTISFWRKKNGTLTQIATSAGTFTPTGDHTMEFRVSGTGASISLECLFDGVSKATYSDTSADRLTALGSAGFVIGYASTTVGYHVDSITATDSAAAAATETTLSGPSTCVVGTPSSNFTVGANGSISGTVTVTPSDGGNGGTFTPTTVDISSGTPTATFTYTAASSGAKTISISDNGGLTDAAPLTVSATSNSTIAITTPVAGRIHQRSGTTGTITVTGVYSGGTPSSIEARVVLDGTNTPVSGHDWTTRVASPAGGAFSFSIPAVPQGGWYNVQVRYSNETGVTATSGKVGVGVLIGIVGQSNAWYWFRTFGTSTDPNDKVRVYGNITTGTWALPTKASMAGAVALGNALVAALNVPVGVLDYAANGGALSLHWVPVTNTTNRTFTNGVGALDDKLEAICWLQGEGDAAAFRTQAQYYGDLGTLFADWRAQFSQSSLPIVLATIGRATSGLYTDAQSQAIFDAQVQKCADANIYRVDRKDLALSDTVHHDAAGYTTLGNRFARAILYAMGSVPTYRGPRISSATKINSATVDVGLTHDYGTDITPSVDITGLRVFDNGVEETITSAVRAGASTVRLTVSGSLDGTITLDHLYGNYPPILGVVRDNSALSLPLEGMTTVTAGVSSVSGVTISPDTATVSGNATRQFSASVAGTGSPSQDVSWSSSAGSISSSGLFTAPIAIVDEQTITITATSVQDDGYSDTATVTVPPASATRTVSLTLVSAASGGTAVASLTGLKWSFFDQTDPSLFIAPTAQGNTGSTDTLGVLTLDVTGTTLAVGATGWLVVTDSDGTVTQAPPHKAFSGPVLVSE